MANKLYEENDIQAIATAIRNKNGSFDTYRVSEMATAINNIPSGSGPIVVEKKDVNFYDYDGTIVASYTASEFASLEELPNNPTHSGLTAQGWNWNLSDAKSYVADYGKLNIGQMYITDDNKTRIYIKLQEGRLSPYLGFTINGSATVDWGDGQTQTVTGTSITTLISTKHDYATEGDYVITIDSPSQIYLWGNFSYGSYLLWNNIRNSNSSNKAYQTAIQKVELGNNINIRDYAFRHCYSLSSVTIPSSVTSIGDYTFNYCYSLSSVTIPSPVTSIGQYAFQYCYSLASLTIPNRVTNMNIYAFQSCCSLSSVTIPNGVLNIPQTAFQYCYSLASLTIPNGVTSIGQYAFQSCYSIAKYDFTSHTSVPTLLNTNAFSGIVTDCKIIVPDNLYEDWILATNWSTYADYIVKESEYND